MNIRDLQKQQADAGKPIRLIHSSVIDEKRKREEERVEIEDTDLKEMKGMTFRKIEEKENFKQQRTAMNVDKDVPKEKVLGVDIRESIEDDVFGAGGPFDAYKREKIKEALQYIEEQKSEAELEGKILVEGGVDLKPIIPVDAAEQAELDAAEDEEKRSNKKQQLNNVVQIQSGQNDPKFKFKIQEDDIFD